MCTKLDLLSCTIHNVIFKKPCLEAAGFFYIINFLDEVQTLSVNLMFFFFFCVNPILVWNGSTLFIVRGCLVEMSLVYSRRFLLQRSLLCQVKSL